MKAIKVIVNKLVDLEWRAHTVWCWNGSQKIEGREERRRRSGKSVRRRVASSHPEHQDVILSAFWLTAATVACIWQGLRCWSLHHSHHSLDATVHKVLVGVGVLCVVHWHYDPSKVGVGVRLTVGAASTEDGRRLCHSPSHRWAAGAVQVLSGAHPGSRANQTGWHGPRAPGFHDSRAQLEFPALKMYLLLSDWLNVDVFIEVHKPVPFADPSTVWDNFYFLHCTISCKDIPYFSLIHLHVNPTNKEGVGSQFARRKNVAIW